MNISREKDRLTLTNRSEALRSRAIAATVGVAMSILLLGIALTRSATFGRIAFAALLIVGFLSLAIAGAVVVWGFPSSTVVVDRGSGRLTMNEAYAFGTKQASYRFDELESFSVVDIGTEYSEFEIRFTLKNGNEIPLFPSTSYDNKPDAEQMREIVQSYVVLDARP